MGHLGNEDTANPSLENTAEGPPFAPGTHLSGPDKHPTPGQYVCVSRHIPVATPPCVVVITSPIRMTAPTTIGAHFGSFICLSSIILLLDIANIRLECTALLGQCATGVDGHRIQLAQGGKLSILSDGTVNRTVTGRPLRSGAVSQRCQLSFLQGTNEVSSFATSHSSTLALVPRQVIQQSSRLFSLVCAHFTLPRYYSSSHTHYILTVNRPRVADGSTCT